MTILMELSRLKCLAVVCVLCVVAIGAGRAGSNPDLLFTYGGTGYTTKSLTGMTYAEGVQTVREIEAAFDMANHSPPTGLYLPSTTLWKSAQGKGLVDYYRNALNGVIERFALRKVFDEFLKRHPNADVAAYYNSEAIAHYAEVASSVWQRGTDAYLFALAEAADGPSFARMVKDRLGGATDARFIEKEYASLKRVEPYRLVHGRCSPFLVNGEPAPWFRDSCYTSMLMYHVEAEIRRDKNRYVALLEDKFGSYNALLFKNVFEKDKDAILKLVQTLSSEDGTVALKGMEKANRTLLKLGSKTRIEWRRGPKKYLAHIYQLPVDQLKARRLLEVRARRENAVKDSKAYLYIRQTKPTPHFTEYNPEPGGFLYDCGHAALLGPIVREVLDRLEMATGLREPTIEHMLSDARRGVVLRAIYGHKLPEVIHARKE